MHSINRAGYRLLLIPEPVDLNTMNWKEEKNVKQKKSISVPFDHCRPTYDMALNLALLVKEFYIRL